jgi:hypothetical protein
MKEYNKEKNDEYDTLHFADDIVVDDKNLPKVFTPINDWRDLTFCNKNGIRTDDGKSLRNANRGIVKGAIKDKYRRINAGEEDPWNNKK